MTPSRARATRLVPTIAGNPLKCSGARVASCGAATYTRLPMLAPTVTTPSGDGQPHVQEVPFDLRLGSSPGKVVLNALAARTSGMAS